MSYRRLYEKVLDVIRPSGSALVAFSGGVDSTLLLKAAVDALGNGAEAALAVSPLYPRFERERAVELADRFGARLHRLEHDVLADPRIAGNPVDRCYHCKTALFRRMTVLAGELGLAAVMEGTCLDDLNEHRPGRRALEELGIASPLLQAGLRKSEIREISRDLGLPTHDAPSRSCLATRFPYDTRLTAGKLELVEKAESELISRGYGQFRVRVHGDIARLELDEAGMTRVMRTEERRWVISMLTGLGFNHVTLDLQGYRGGGFDQILLAERGERNG